MLAVATLACPLALPQARAGSESHDLAITVEADSAVVADHELTITMTVRNDGPDPAGSTFLSTETPSGTVFVSASASQGHVTQSPAPNETGAVEVSVGAMSNNQSETVTLVLRVVATAGSTIEFMATYQPPNPSEDQNQDNNSDSAEIAVTGPSMADIELEAEGEDDVAGAGSLFDYSITVTNISNPARDAREPAVGVMVTGHVPSGTTFSSIDTSQGTAEGPPVGESGGFAVDVGTLEDGESATIDLVLEVGDSAKGSIAFEAEATLAGDDPDPSNNSASVDTPIEPSDDGSVSWDAPEEPTAEDPLPPPQHLVVDVDGEGARHFAISTVQRGSSVTGYNVYRSNKPGVTPSAGSLFMSVPPSQTNVTSPVSPGGTFFTVTATYANGESAPSNEGSGNVAAANLTKVKVKSTKINATGTGFSDTVTVLVDGIPFTAPAAVKKNNTKVVQKGGLITGQSLGAYLAAHPSVLITFRNSNGGIAAYRHPN